LLVEKFLDIHIEDSARLFRNDYCNLKSQFNCLPNKYESLENICSNLNSIIHNHPSYVAIEENQIVGYITGYSAIKKLKGSFAGVYVPEWGHSSKSTQRKYIYNKLYSKISAIWSNNGILTHMISYLASLDLVGIFSTLGFGMYGIDAIRRPETIKKDLLTENEVELASKKHILTLREFSILMDHHLESAPIFLKRNLSGNSYTEEKITNDFLSSNILTLLVKKNEQIVSCIRCKKNHGNISMINTKGTFSVNFGFTRDEYRRKGIASKLLNNLLEIIQQDGCIICSVDFETQNSEGMEFWLKYFEPIAYSMIRKIDDRIT
jgi:predicted GNAT family acetyltransferase